MVIRTIGSPSTSTRLIGCYGVGTLVDVD
jgi:hypothetical protein